MSLTRDDLVRWLQSALRANEHDWTNEADRDKESSRLQSIFDLALSALTARAEGLLEWLDNNTTYYDVKQPAVEAPNVPVLAKVSKRIWYHATDDQLSYPFSDVIRAALSPRETDADPQVPLSARTGSAAEVDSRSGATVESATSARATSAASAPSAEVAEMVRRLKQFSFHLRTIENQYAETMREKIDKDAANLMEDAAAPLSKVGQGWVPVSERLPTTPSDPVTAARVLVWTVRDDMGWIATRFFRDGKWWSGGDQVDGETITHWRDLPPPPERP